jgi:hypothetical protein
LFKTPLDALGFMPRVSSSGSDSSGYRVFLVLTTTRDGPQTPIKCEDSELNTREKRVLTLTPPSRRKRVKQEVVIKKEPVTKEPARREPLKKEGTPIKQESVKAAPANRSLFPTDDEDSSSDSGSEDDLPTLQELSERHRAAAAEANMADSEEEPTQVYVSSSQTHSPPTDLAREIAAASCSGRTTRYKGKRTLATYKASKKA